MATQNIDYATSGGAVDTGEDNTPSIHPIEDGEAATAAVLGRADENLRIRTELIRGVLEDELYLNDADRAILLTGGGNITWGGTVSLGGTGAFTLTGDLILKPFLAPTVSTAAKHTIGSVSNRQVVVSTILTQVGSVVPPRAYSGANKISVQVNSVTTGTGAVTVEINGTRADQFVITYDADGTSGTTCQQLVDALNATIGFSNIGLTATLGGTTTGSNKASGADSVVYLLSGAADAERHEITPSGLVSFFSQSANQMVEGDVLCIWYDQLVADGTYGGRRQSLADAPEHSNVVDSNLFVLRNNPERLPLAIPVGAIVDNQLVLVSGDRIATNVATPLGGTTYGGSGPWADSTTIPAGTFEAAIDGVVSALGGSSGALKVGKTVTAPWANSDAVTGSTLDAIIEAIVSGLASITASHDGAARIGLATASGTPLALSGSVRTALTTIAARYNSHINASADKHAAANVVNTPAGNIASTDVQAALNELDTEKVALTRYTSHITGAADKQPAASVVNTPAGNIASTDVQAALNELDSEKAGLTLANIFSALQTLNGASGDTNASAQMSVAPTNRKLLFTLKNSSTVFTRIYVEKDNGTEEALVAGFSGGLSIVVNAAWDGSNWIPDDTAHSVGFLRFNKDWLFISSNPGSSGSLSDSTLTGFNIFTLRFNEFSSITAGSVLGSIGGGAVQLTNVCHEPFHYIGSGGGEPAFGSGWAASTGSNALCFWRDAFGTVHLEGSALFNGTSPPAAFTLPTAYRPKGAVTFPIYTFGTGGGIFNCLIATSGTVLVQGTSGSVNIVASFNGMTFNPDVAAA